MLICKSLLTEEGINKIKKMENLCIEKIGYKEFCFVAQIYGNGNVYMGILDKEELEKMQDIIVNRKHKILEEEFAWL